MTLRVRSSRPLATSQSLIFLSAPAEARVRPSGERRRSQLRRYARESMQLAPAGHVPELDGVVLALPEASMFPSGLKLTDDDLISVAAMVRSSLPARHVPEFDRSCHCCAEASTWPSGENATELTPSECR